MPNLDNLLKKIADDGKARAKQITDEAEAKAKEIAENKLAGANAEKDRIIAAAKEEAAKQKDLIISGKRLEIRDKTIGAKRKIIERVFSDAQARLGDIPEEEFKKFLVSQVKASELSGEVEILLPEKYGKLDINAINGVLKGAGKNISLKRGQGSSPQGGFVLKSGGIEQNQTFGALLDYQRDSLEALVIESLF